MRARTAWRAAGLTLVLTAALLAAVSLPSAAPSGADGDGGRFAFLKTYDRGFTYRIVVTGPRGGDRRWVRRPAIGRPAFSPDGRRVAFASPLTDGSDGRYGIFIANLATGSVRRVTAPRFADLDPAWSPNGKRLAFSRILRGTSRPDDSAVFTKWLDGRRPRRVAGTRGGITPAWAPDSRTLAYVKPAGLYRTRGNGTQRRRLAAGRVADPAWRPDGKRLAFVRLRSTSRVRLVTIRPYGSRRGTSVRVDSGRLLETPAWGPGQTLYWMAYQGQGDEGRFASAVWRQTSADARPVVIINDRAQTYRLAHTPHSPKL